MVIGSYPPLSMEDWPPLRPPTPKVWSSNVLKGPKKKRNKSIAISFSIPFHRLPLLVQVQMIQTMDPEDWINLAMTSKRNERVVKLARIKTERPCVEICLDACVRFSPINLNLRYNSMQWKTNKWKTKTTEEAWLSEPSSSMIKNAATLYQKTRNVFVFPNDGLNISFCTDIESKATIGELLSNSVMKNWRELSIYGKKISSEDLRMIMDTATLDRHFESRVEEMPLDFKHENAFKFASQDYHDARWVRIEDLQGLKNCINVTLLRNNFTQEQIKSFINYWVNSKVDMFWWMKIVTKDETNFENLVNGYLGLRWSSLFNTNIFFMLSKTTSAGRKKTMLAISCFRNELILSAFAEDENFLANKDREELNKIFRNCREILTKLQEKKELEDLREIGSEEEKVELEAKIGDVVAKLEELEVFFRNGNAWLI